MWTTSDKDYIIKNIDQAHVYSVFLNIPECEINQCICVRNYKVSNPLRFDPNPSVGFKWYSSKLIMRDFADHRYRGDIFEIVGLILKKNCANNKDFIDICSSIIEYCSDAIKDTPYMSRVYQHQNKIVSNDFHIITTVNRKASFYDYRFYSQFGIPNNFVDEEVKVVESFKIDDIPNPYYYTRHDPCYEYQVNLNCKKLYFPFRDKHTSNRFVTNNKCPLENIDTVTDSDYKLIVKSQKDKLLIIRILIDLCITNVGVYVIASETSKLPDDIVSILKNSTRLKIFVMLDTDSTGLKSAIEYRDNYNFIPIFLTKGYSAKDPTDLVRLTNYEHVLKRFANVYLNEMINDR